MIRFLIKLSFFLFFIFLIISFFVAKPSNNHSSMYKNNEATTSDIMIALKEALNDLGKFCDRNIETCKVGKAFLSSLGERAYYGARAVYDYLGHMLNDKNMAASPNLTPKTETQIPYKKHISFS
ncbi:DUF5330 domain-containing protein [Bartonella raoultii]|uniref:DUF5330 domain-containing protein n=1 Tax=Bartonella raoultii TaxID=1457020 RepID=A0ABS7I951_9HYPH|nr:DUF5330 domain-containing protein [Bartonella raoultii]MBX4336114.1 DUF5330 domain-containing protein [Bartonella raoultii]